MHKGKLLDGTPVAIKIQKPELKSQVEIDLFMHSLVCHVLDYSFDLPLSVFASFVEENLRKELDFEHEHHNMEVARSQLTNPNI